MPNLNVYEKRPDWAAIVSAIPCPQQGCGAQIGQTCRNVGAGAYTLRSEQPRSDWHMTRKFLAVQIFEQQEPKPSTGGSDAAEEGNEPENGDGGGQAAETGSGDSPVGEAAEPEKVDD